MRCLFIITLVLCGNTYAKMAQNASADMAFAPEPPTYPVPVAAIKVHYQNLMKTRTLNAEEVTIQNMASVASIFKVQQITSQSQDVAHTQLASLSRAIVAKIKEHPKWDATLSATEIQAITPHQELLKTTFGEKSYGWAWFLKQTGKTAEAKQILTTLLNERIGAVMKMTGTYNRQSPLMPVVEIEQALLPLLTQPEQANVEKKMQDLKVHISNLKDYSIMT